MWLNGEVLFIVFGWPVLMLCVCVCVYVSSAWNGWLASQPSSERAFNIALKSLQTHERAWNPFIYSHLASDWVNTRELGRGRERERLVDGRNGVCQSKRKAPFKINISKHKHVKRKFKLVQIYFHWMDELWGGPFFIFAFSLIQHKAHQCTGQSYSENAFQHQLTVISIEIY